MIQQQLNQYYEYLRLERTQQLNIRKWCLTLWVAVLGLVGSGKLDLQPTQIFILIYSPIFIFWILEAFDRSFSYRLTIKIKELEKKILHKDEIVETDFYVNFLLNVSLKTKIIDFIKVTFSSEVLLIFYLILIFASTMFYVSVV